MKFWQLMSLCGAESGLMLMAAATNPSWSEFADSCRREDELIDRQDRAALDFELPIAYVRAVLAELNLTFYMGQDDYLRSYRLRQTDTRLSAYEAHFLGYGDVLEDVREKSTRPLWWSADGRRQPVEGSTLKPKSRLAMVGFRVGVAIVVVSLVGMALGMAFHPSFVFGGALVLLAHGVDARSTFVWRRRLLARGGAEAWLSDAWAAWKAP